MVKNKELYGFLCERIEQYTNQWYETLDKSAGGVYGSTNSKAVERLKQQNHEFHQRFCLMFDSDEHECTEHFKDWIIMTARDEGHLSTPLTAILNEFFRTQMHYVKLIEEFGIVHKEAIPNEQLALWKQAVVTKINEIVLEFTEQHTCAAEERLNAQKELMVEMSAPVILLSKEVGLLPLVGDIDTYRAQVIFEKVLNQCHESTVEKLFIDLSGVPIIDTMVANKIFQLIEGLKIIGVNTALSGISPEIAQTLVQLGINFKDINVYSTLTQAMRILDLNSELIKAN